MNGPIIKTVHGRNEKHLRYLTDLACEVQQFCYLVEEGEAFDMPFMDKVYDNVTKALGMNIYNFQVAIEHVFKDLGNKLPTFNGFDTPTDSDICRMCSELWHYVLMARNLTDTYDAICKRNPEFEDKFKWMQYVPVGFQFDAGEDN